MKDAEEFLQSKDVWNHPRVTDRNEKASYDVAELMEEYAQYRISLLKGDIKYQISRIPDRPELNHNYTAIDQGFLLCFRTVERMIERIETK